MAIAYMNIVNALVDEGYIIALPKMEGSLSPNHLEFARDLLFLVNYLTETENNTVFSQTDVMGKCIRTAA